MIAIPRRSCWPLFVLMIAIVAGCGPEPAATTPPVAGASDSPAPNSPEPKTEKVQLLLNWFPEAEHGGFYAAQIHGYYKNLQLEVEIIPGGPNSPVVQQVASGKVQFGVTNADNVIFGRAEDVPVVAVMAPLQTSPRCLMVHEKSGIKGFEDLKDMTIAMSATNAFSHYLRKKFPFTGVRMVPYPGNITQFLQDEKFAQQGYTFSEPILARQQGSDPKVLLVADVAFNPYTSCLITHDKIANEPSSSLVTRMVAASVQGWQKYLTNPEETNAHIRKLNPEMSPEMLADGVTELRELVVTKEVPIERLGSMTKARWEELVRQLVEIEQIKPDRVQVEKLFSTEFLPPEEVISELQNNVAQPANSKPE